MTRLLRLLGAAALAAFLVAACGGGDDGGSAAPAGTTSAAAPTSAAPSASVSSSASSASSSSSSSSGGGQAAASGTITIKDFKYSATLTVKPGATITVVNQDVARHDVVADQQGLFKTELLGQGGTATFTAPTTPGSYTFSCSVHRNMTSIGTLVVQG